MADKELETVLAALRAAGEPTRLRLLAVLAQAELTVTEMTQVLGQSQPRISRHLKLMVEAGLLDRQREGAWAFYRLADQGPVAHLVSTIVDLLPADEESLKHDLDRLDAIRAARAEAAAQFFRANAAQWDRIRSLHLPEAQVETAILDLIVGPDRTVRIGDHLDLGTGTGRILEIFAPYAARGTGIDQSHEMLAVARANLEHAQLRNIRVRHGDICDLRLPPAADLVTIHQVLHYLDEPQAAIREAAAALAPGGQLLVADFAPHDLVFLRDEQAHRRLGLGEAEVDGWCRAAGLEPKAIRHLDPAAHDPNQLTVTLWLAQKPGKRAAAAH